MSVDLEAVLARERLVVAAFSSRSCPPCRALAAALEAELPSHPSIAVVHIDIAGDLALAHAQGVRGTPTLVGYVCGRAVARDVGFAGVPRLRRFLADLEGR